MNDHRRWLYRHLNTLGTVVVFGPPADLIAVVVNTAVAAAVATVFDANETNTTALTTVAVVDASATGTYFYGAQCLGGIVVQLATGAADLTIIYEPYPTDFAAGTGAHS